MRGAVVAAAAAVIVVVCGCGYGVWQIPHLASANPGRPGRVVVLGLSDDWNWESLWFVVV